MNLVIIHCGEVFIHAQLVSSDRGSLIWCARGTAPNNQTLRPLEVNEALISVVASGVLKSCDYG
ncbi:hypothetical protein [Paenibacillus sp. SYP-B3998]|uniref:hypothetical protein n=1 Tax=Paenibacillus sp. SYP-B3998 TaxID=2678564 RepID=UPI0013D72E4E|nr:hypothetical protein [Paenibacillus sp. SYP-B3998]